MSRNKRGLNPRVLGRLIKAAIIVLGVAFCTALYGLGFIQNVKQRTLRYISSLSNEPIEITAVKIEGQNVGLNQKFSAKDDWMKGLAISIQNRSNKRILLVSFDFFFPAPANSQAKASVFKLTYGNYGLVWDHSPTPTERLIGIEAGANADVVCSGQRYENFTKFFADVGRPDATTVNIRLATVIFDDDTMWDLGDYYRRNAKDPSAWIRLEQSFARPTKTR